MKKIYLIFLICLIPIFANAQEVSLVWEAPAWSGTITGYRIWMGNAVNDCKPLSLTTTDLKMPLSRIPNLTIGKWLSVSTLSGNLESAPAVPIQWNNLPPAPGNVKITTTVTITTP